MNKVTQANSSEQDSLSWEENWLLSNIRWKFASKAIVAFGAIALSASVHAKNHNDIDSASSVKNQTSSLVSNALSQDKLWEIVIQDEIHLVDVLDMHEWLTFTEREAILTQYRNTFSKLPAWAITKIAFMDLVIDSKADLRKISNDFSLAEIIPFDEIFPNWVDNLSMSDAENLAKYAFDSSELSQWYRVWTESRMPTAEEIKKQAKNIDFWKRRYWKLSKVFANDMKC